MSVQQEIDDQGDPGGGRAGPAGSGGLSGRPPVEPAVSEACRLLCAGVYLDPVYRDAVLDELYVHEERFPAHSVGFDAARVLAHAARARRLDTGRACAVGALWLIALVTGGLPVFIMLLCSVCLALEPVVSRHTQRLWLLRLALSFTLRWGSRLWLFLAFLLLVLGAAGVFGTTVSVGDPAPVGAFDGPTEALRGSPTLLADGLSPASSLLALVLLVLIGVLVGLSRGVFARTLTNELSEARFSAVVRDPAELAPHARLDRLRRRLRAEQHVPVVMYGAAEPFRGFGEPHGTFTLSVELVPDAEREQQPLTNAEFLERIRLRVEALRETAQQRSVGNAAAVRDRLRELVVDECVFLPVDGLPGRTAAPYGPDAYEWHRAEAVEEGGETRRHFLRIRVGGWREDVVTTVFVRVHTQGGMLMLEFAPHVLMPVRADFHEADRQAYRYLRNGRLGKAAWALSHTPVSAAEAAWTLLRWAVDGWRRATAGNATALPEGPALSVRELGSADTMSLFQRMDVDRYLKSILDRVGSGVSVSLHEAGYRVEQFEKKIVNVADGAVFIESATNSAIGIGDHNTVSNRNEGSGKRDGEQ